MDSLKQTEDTIKNKEEKNAARDALFAASLA